MNGKLNKPRSFSSKVERLEVCTPRGSTRWNIWETRIAIHLQTSMNEEITARFREGAIQF